MLTIAPVQNKPKLSESTARRLLAASIHGLAEDVRTARSQWPLGVAFVLACMGMAAIMLWRM